METYVDQNVDNVPQFPLVYIQLTLRSWKPTTYSRFSDLRDSLDCIIIDRVGAHYFILGSVLEYFP